MLPWTLREQSGASGLLLEPTWRLSFSRKHIKVTNRASAFGIVRFKVKEKLGFIISKLNLSSLFHHFIL